MSKNICSQKAGSGNIAEQVIKYENRKRVVVKHVGSAQTKEEITILRNNAADRISEQTEQISLFPTQEEHFISLEQYEYFGF